MCETAEAPASSPNTAPTIGIVVSITTDAITRPTVLCGSTSP